MHYIFKKIKKNKIDVNTGFNINTGSRDTLLNKKCEINKLNNKFKQIK